MIDTEAGPSGVPKRLQRDDFAVVADEGNGFVGNALADGQILRFGNLARRVEREVHQPRLVQTERSLYFQNLTHGLIEPLRG